jgi:hypothetical protein
MKFNIRGKGSVSLTKQDFVASGGEGSVYAKGGVAYKIYHDAARMISPDKIVELSSITKVEVAKPEHVLLNGKGKPVGYSYRYINNAVSLCQAFTRAFKDRNSISNDMVGALVTNIQDTLQHIHGVGILVVDLNEMNLLIEPGFSKVAWIDVDSWQTRSFPATAIMESVRDYSSNKFSEMTDWFSFAIVTFQLWIGIHPYKGKHLSVRNFKERMKSNLSVFNSKVKVPKVCPPLDIIPNEYFDWYYDIFEKGKRSLPPSVAKIVSKIIPKVFRKISGTDNLTVTKIADYEYDIIDFRSFGSHKFVFSKKGLHVGRALYVGVQPTSHIAITPHRQHVVVADCHSGKPKLRDITKSRDFDLNLHTDGIMSYDGRIFYKTGDSLCEVQFLETSTDVAQAMAKGVVNILPQAIKMFDGVLFQSILGAWYVSIFPELGRSYQFHFKEFDGWKIIDAKYDSLVLMVVGVKSGTYKRWVFFFTAGYDGYSCEQVCDITYSGINFVVLSNGVCAHINEKEQLELFANRSPLRVKIVEDRMLGSDMRLYKSGTDVLFSQGKELFKVSTRR